ncbi:MAG: hypothetical protein EXQ81_02065 [Thermoleophilia bacterium]|nr:hypothetical protein [Thermoleophilia bacterium]
MGTGRGPELGTQRGCPTGFGAAARVGELLGYVVRTRGVRVDHAPEACATKILCSRELIGRERGGKHGKAGRDGRP